MKNKVESITIIADDYPAPGHIMMVFIQELVHAIIELGINVTVVACQSVTHALFHMEKLLPVYSKGVTPLGKEYEIYRPYILSFGNKNPIEWMTQWFNRHSIESKLKKIGSDVIYCHFWSSAIPVYEYALSNKIPLFIACGEGDNALEEMIATIPEKKRSRLKTAVNGVISVSSENKRKCIEFNLVNERNIEVFPNCVNTNIFHRMDVTELKKQLGIKDDDFVISFVGGFIPRKGPDRIAQALTKLNDPNIKVIFIGKPFKGYPYDFDCPGIVYKGSMEHIQIPKYLNCSDVFIMPTQKEGCCNAIIEALAMSIPIISSIGSFNDDILDNKNSIRIDPNNIDAISTAIMTLKNNKELRASMAKYSLSKHEEYSINGRAKRIIEFINKHI